MKQNKFNLKKYKNPFLKLCEWQKTVEERRWLRSAELFGRQTRNSRFSHSRLYVFAVGRERRLCGSSEQDSHRHRVCFAHASGRRAVSPASVRDNNREEQSIAHDCRHR